MDILYFLLNGQVIRKKKKRKRKKKEKEKVVGKPGDLDSYKYVPECQKLRKRYFYRENEN
jgi:hypothetical protein